MPGLVVEDAFARGGCLCIERDDPLLVVVGDGREGVVEGVGSIDLGEGGDALQVDETVVEMGHEVDGAVAVDAGVDGVARTAQDEVDLVFEACLGIGAIVGIEQGGE